MISKKFRDEVFVNFLFSLLPLCFFVNASTWDEAKEISRPIFMLMAFIFVVAFLPKDPQMEAFIRNGTRHYRDQMYQNRTFHGGNLFTPYPHHGQLFGLDFLNINRSFSGNYQYQQNPPSEQQNPPSEQQNPPSEQQNPPQYTNKQPVEVNAPH